MDKIIFDEINIEKFRELEDVDIKFGDKLTVISGRNGTGKSSILGLISQMLSFRSVKGKENLDYNTLFEEEFESEFRNHLKISSQFDPPDTKYKINIKLKDIDENYYLGTTTRNGNQIRFVLRGNKDRNFTWPSIYLDLRRLTPISYRKEEYKKSINFSKDEEQDLKEWTNAIIPKPSPSTTISNNLPEQDIKSTVVTNNHYDIESASSGEDNVGQILVSLLSFSRLKKEYDDYLGGILLIDELDATLFPNSQIKMIDILIKQAKKLNLQIIFTTHSATMLNYLFEKQKITQQNSKSSNDIQINYLSNSSGKISNLKFNSVNELLDDLELKTGVQKEGLIRVNVYCEDEEANDMLYKILPRDISNEIIRNYNTSLGADQYNELIRKRITEFSKNSIIVLDGDQKTTYKNVVCLPFELPPDQLVYNYLENLEATDPYWQNKLNLDKTKFGNIEAVNAIRSNLKFNEKNKKYEKISNKDYATRKYFKDFYRDPTIKKLMRTKDCNVFTILKNSKSKEIKEEIERFISSFQDALNFVKNNIYM